MKLKKAMALALAGALVLTTAVTGTTSEAAKKTKLKTKKVSIFVKGKKKISITAIKGDAATIETDSLEAALTGVKTGEVTVTVTVKVKDGNKTGEGTASKTIEVIGKDLNLVLSADTLSKRVPYYFAKAADITYS